MRELDKRCDCSERPHTRKASRNEALLMAATRTDLTPFRYASDMTKMRWRVFVVIAA
jgi:hypothetical protein